MILTVGAPAAGGACVARDPDGKVVFVRHALPGERVRVEITSSGTAFSRADAVAWARKPTPSAHCERVRQCHSGSTGSTSPSQVTLPRRASWSRTTAVLSASCADGEACCQSQPPHVPT